MVSFGSPFYLRDIVVYAGMLASCLRSPEVRATFLSPSPLKREISLELPHHQLIIEAGIPSLGGGNLSTIGYSIAHQGIPLTGCINLRNNDAFVIIKSADKIIPFYREIPLLRPDLLGNISRQHTMESGTIEKLVEEFERLATSHSGH